MSGQWPILFQFYNYNCGSSITPWSKWQLLFKGMSWYTSKSSDYWVKFSVQVNDMKSCIIPWHFVFDPPSLSLSLVFPNFFVFCNCLLSLSLVFHNLYVFYFLSAMYKVRIIVKPLCYMSYEFGPNVIYSKTSVLHE